MTLATINAKSDESVSVTELVRAAQSGDRQATGKLFERYEQMVYGVAYRRLGNSGDAQELAQEVFVQALQKLSQLRVPECFGSWLRSITVRMAINRVVRGDRAVSTEPKTLEAACMESRTPDDFAVDVERAASVRAGLRRLGAMDRDTLTAFYVRGQSLVEMSVQFDAPIGTIKRRLHVARRRLAKELEHLVVA
jgi:RNA polymerase sigma-70 factor (ECF subfamily)